MNENIPDGEVKVTGSMLDSLRATKPWTRLLAILGFIGTGLMILLGAGLMIFASLFSQQRNAPPPWFGLLYIVFALLYLFPALYLFRYSSSLGNFLKSSAATDLESALSHQKSFWKFTGVMALVGMVVGLLGIAAAIAIPLLIKMRMH